jgi:hypothetical protein
MPVLLIASVDGGTADQDDDFVKVLGLAENPPAGARIRMAGPTETGWRIVSLWDSRESFEAFLEQRLRPALTDQGRSVGEFDFWPIERVITYP